MTSAVGTGDERVVGERFYLDTVRGLVREGWMAPDDHVLVVAGGHADRAVLLAAGLRRVTISNLDERMDGGSYAPYAWSFQDAEALGFPDDAFDVCVVHQGLHHCRSPHRGLLEMYRVARRGLVMFEPQDTALTRLGVRLGVGQRYELAAVADNGLRWGGVQNTDVPNFVYRWTEREVRKALASYDPTRDPAVRVFHDLRVPGEATAATRGAMVRGLARVATPVARAVLRVVPRQANALAVVVDKVGPGDLHPWLARDGGAVRADPEYFGRRPRSSRRSGDDG